MSRYPYLVLPISFQSLLNDDLYSYHNLKEPILLKEEIEKSKYNKIIFICTVALIISFLIGNKIFITLSILSVTGSVLILVYDIKWYQKKNNKIYLIANLKG